MGESGDLAEGEALVGLTSLCTRHGCLGGHVVCLYPVSLVNPTICESELIGAEP